ncbi:diguanylate cyclase domain-containing protein [Paenibacillus qinlingensis]|uniref:diguanylate cyclase domain-containing protein n=1 Tax=Paenibacillus qinlingensis TaxID=1837343 RepID=UPI001565904A|nr:diguanylate cyclase [Paenibacillus qinlingensis]NQX58208.1 diguanylate cyclase [Paenibacillus qinlingensis]
MLIALNELQFYKNFDELAKDILEMAKETMPDRLIYLTSFTKKQQIILKLSEINVNIGINEGMVIEINETVCNRIDFENNTPLVFEDMGRETKLDDLRQALVAANINSYLGIPIILSNGDTFGTLCAVHTNAKKISKKSITMLQRIAKLFSYYLDLERLAYRDSLTGLYNRQFLYKYFEDISTTGGALLFLDLDGFKKVNDLYGHETGDLVLREVALRLENFIQQRHGFAVRLGGDEFIVNLVDLTSREEISKLADFLLSRLSTWDTQLEAFNLSVSIGIVIYPADDNNLLKTLLKNADNALYRAKANGKNGYQFF